MRFGSSLVALLSILPLAPLAGQAGDGFTTRLAMASGITAMHVLWYPRASYAGRDEAGVPRYVRRSFSEEERRRLREQFGIEDPSRLYLSDSSTSGYLVYDTERDPGAGRLVRSYRVGAASIRRPGETWEQLERRLRRMRPEDFPASVRKAETSIDSLAPGVRDHFAGMLADARAAGFRVRVTESRRSAERQAYLMVVGGGLTFTATSMHSSGHAIDVAVGDGNLKNPRTRARWIAFRRWVAAYDGGRFRLIGMPDRSWDWPHIELADSTLGFSSVESLLLAAQARELTCCDPLPAPVHSTHDPARSGATPLAGPGSSDDTLRLDGTSGWAALPAR
jgi:hypothetical protein